MEGNPVKYVQNGNGYNGAGEFLGPVDSKNLLMKPAKAAKAAAAKAEDVKNTDNSTMDAVPAVDDAKG